MRTYVLTLDGVFDLGLAALLDTLSTAHELGQAAPARASARSGLRVVGVRQRVRTLHGLTVPVVPVARLPRPDVVLVPALGQKTPDSLAAALERTDVADAGALLRRWAAAGTLIGAACTGTFVLAEAGLLDGHSATTTWWLAPLFRQRYPRVALDESRMIVESAQVVTAGAALAHLDLALWMVRRSSPALAALTARYLIVDPRPSQAAYVIPDHLAHADPIVERFEHWARHSLAERFSLSAAAQSVGASERTLARRLRTVLGKSPLSYVQDLRVERAVHLLQTTDASIDQIAAQVGYGDGVTLRTLLRRKTGRGVRELRARALDAGRRRTVGPAHLRMPSRSAYAPRVVTNVGTRRSLALLALCVAGCGFSRVDGANDPDLGIDASVGETPDLIASNADLTGLDLSPPPPSPKRLFVSHDAYAGSMSASQGGSPGLLGGDSLCTNIANAAHIGGIWRAWLSDAHNDAIDRITGVGPWKRMDGQVAFADRAALLVGPAVPINLDQTGTRVPVSSAVWTGTLANGRYSQKTTTGKGNCDDWTNAGSPGSDPPLGDIGDTETLDGGWTAIYTHSCYEGARLYCFEQ